MYMSTRGSRHDIYMYSEQHDRRMKKSQYVTNNIHLNHGGYMSLGCQGVTCGVL